MQQSELTALLALIVAGYLCYLMARWGDGKPKPRAVLDRQTYESVHTVVREAQPAPPPRLLVLVVREGREEEDLGRQLPALPSNAEVIDAEFLVKRHAPGDRMLPDNRPAPRLAARKNPDDT